MRDSRDLREQKPSWMRLETRAQLGDLSGVKRGEGRQKLGDDGKDNLNGTLPIKQSTWWLIPRIVSGL